MAKIADDSGNTAMSWTHESSGNIHAEALISHIGNKIIDVVMIQVDENGMPV